MVRFLWLPYHPTPNPQPADETTSARVGGRNPKSFQVQAKRRATTIGVTTTLQNRTTMAFISTQ